MCEKSLKLMVLPCFNFRTVFSVSLKVLPETMLEKHHVTSASIPASHARLLKSMVSVIHKSEPTHLESPCNFITCASNFVL